MSLNYLNRLGTSINEGSDNVDEENVLNWVQITGIGDQM